MSAQLFPHGSCPPTAGTTQPTGRRGADQSGRQAPAGRTPAGARTTPMAAHAPRHRGSQDPRQTNTEPELPARTTGGANPAAVGRPDATTAAGRPDPSSDQ